MISPAPRLYPDQEEFVAGVRDAYRSHRSVLAQAATGFGKTVVAAYIAKAAAAKGSRVYFTVHRKNLIRQTQVTFADWGINYGVIASGHTPRLHEPVQIASIQTLVRRLDKVPACDLLVVDECHLACSPTWSKVLAFYRKHGARLLGNSATPARLDGKPLAKHFDAMVCGPPVRDLIDAGRLSDYRLYAPAEAVDLSGARTRMGDYVTSDLDAIMDHSQVVGDAIDHYRKLMPGKRALAFCVSVKASQHTAERFRQAGIAAAHIDGKTPDAKRHEIIRAFADGRVQVLCNVELITTGFDLSSQVGREVPVEGAIMLRPTQSVALWLQMVGRAMRRKDEPAIIADHANNALRLGLPCEERDWSLDGRDIRPSSNGDTGPAIRHCDRCFCIYPAFKPKCPLCGHAPPIEGRTVDEVEGELEEIDPEVHRRMRRREEAKAGTLEELVELAKERSYKPAWAGIRHAVRKGHKPRSKAARKYVAQAKKIAKNGGGG